MVATRRGPRRVAASRPAAVALPAPAARVPARRSRHIRDAGLVVAVGVAGWGVAPLVGHPGLAVPALAGGLAGGVGLGVVGGRAARRRELGDRVVEALAPLLGVRQMDRRIVRLSRWTRGWPGVPGRVRIHYAPGAPDHDPAWVGQVTTVLAARLLKAYRVVGHDRRRCTVRLALVTGAPAKPAELSPAQLRAERAVGELIGPTAQVGAVELVDGQLRSFTVTHQAGARLAAAGYRTRVERVISTMMPGRWRAVWDLEGDGVRFEVRPVLPSSVWLPVRPLEDREDLLRNYRQVRIPCAVDEDGREVCWYPARVPQAMLTGGTGTGKTSMAHALLGQITRLGWPVWVLDAKRVEFLDFRTWPNVQMVAGSIPQQVALVRRAWELMEYRYRLIEDGRASVQDFEPLVVFLDEFAEFRANLLEWYAEIKVKGDPTRPATLAEVASLARKARTARIHLVLSTQRPDVEFLGGEALAIDTPIPTPSGWTTMGEIRVGQRVFAEDGRPVQVTATTPVMVGRPCFRVRFSDGASIVTDAEHRWAACPVTAPTDLPAAVRRCTAGRGWAGRRRAGRSTRLAVASAASPAVAAVPTVAAGWMDVTGCRTGQRVGRLWDVRAGGMTAAAPPSSRPSRVLAARGVVGCGEVPPAGEFGAARIVTTRQVAESIHSGGGAGTWAVRVARPLRLPPVALPVDPYLLGCWLGRRSPADGLLAAADLPAVGRAAQDLLACLDGRTTSAARRVLRGSVEQRTRLLAGLLHAAHTGRRSCAGRPQEIRVTVRHRDRRLVDLVAELAASLGYAPTVHPAHPGDPAVDMAAAGPSRTERCWAVSFTLAASAAGLDQHPSTAQAAAGLSDRSPVGYRYVVAVEPVPSVPVRCISVDSPQHLYLAGRSFIPTHNCRDNFGFRMSMGRLSPQGAMMMWENPAVGVSLPRGCTGRATATHDDGRPVEVQCYRFPDLHAPAGSEQQRLLEAIRPGQARWPRLLIVPPAVDTDVDTDEDGTSEPRPPTFRDYARARWDLADNRPDLDPLAGSEGELRADGRQLSSTLAALGIRHADTSSPARPRLRLIEPPTLTDPEPVIVDEPGPVRELVEVEEYPGYAPPVGCEAREVTVGDLIEAEPDSGVWVVVDEPPEEDVLDPGLLVISWRGDGDESGLVSMPDDNWISVRRPAEEDVS